MKVGVMQPYFFPYIGYFSLINYVDKFIFFDTPQYISHGWINRNRVLRQDGMPGYIIIPIKKVPQSTAIKDISISTNIEWRNRIYGQLTAYKRRAPYYKETIEFIHSILDKEYEGKLSVLNIETIKAVCAYIGIKKDFDVYSKTNIKINSVDHPDEWALNITNKLDGDVYVNPPGGQLFFDRNKYKEKNIKLEFLQSKLPVYIQRIGHFEAGLSIIDVMMFCSQKEIRDMLGEFIILY